MQVGVKSPPSRAGLQSAFSLFALYLTLQVLFSVFTSQIDSCNEKWEKIRQVRAEAGRKGGAKKGNQNATKQKQTKQAVTVTDTVTGTVTVPVTNRTPDGTAPEGAAPPAKPAQN